MQGFTPNTPVANALAVSADVRNNFAALLSNHAGTTLPAYAVEGTLWYDSAAKAVKVIKPRGTKPFASVAMGPTITLHVSMRQAGVNGGTIAKDVRIQDATLLTSDTDWTSTPAQKLYFSTTKTPSYFAAKLWNDLEVDEPVLETVDGILLGKTWETLVSGTHETIYSTGFMASESGYASSTLRAVAIHPDDATVEISFSTVPSQDHIVLPTAMAWHEVQETGGQRILLKDGVEVDPTRYHIKPFFSGGTVDMAVYSVNATGDDLTPFATGSRYTLRIRKPA